MTAAIARRQSTRIQIYIASAFCPHRGYPGEGPSGAAGSGGSNAHVQNILTRIATAGNTEKPVGARLQSNPNQVQDLLWGESSLTVQAARRGVAYSFDQRPAQLRRPAKMRLNQEQATAVRQETDRLHHACDAVELAPQHDSDKALTRRAQEHEVQPFPRGSWPHEPFPRGSGTTRSQETRHSPVAHLRSTPEGGTPVQRLRTGVFPRSKERRGLERCAPITAVSTRTFPKQDFKWKESNRWLT
jgi:hypothetical protein